MKKEQVLVQIGKNGINEQQIEEIKKNLRSGNNVKVKLLKSHMDSNDRKSSAQKILESLNPIKVKHKLVGNTIFVERTR